MVDQNAFTWPSRPVPKIYLFLSVPILKYTYLRSADFVRYLKIKIILICVAHKSQLSLLQVILINTLSNTTIE